MCKRPPLFNTITSFAGIRAYSSRHDFIIEESKTAKGVIHCAGIESPGLTSAPAIAKYVVETLVAKNIALENNEAFNGYRKPDYFFKNLSMEEKNEIIKKDPSYGTITKIEGDKRVTGVVVSKVDENKNPIPGTEMHFDCDTVLFSVGLIPENELTKGAGIDLSPRTRGAVVSQTRETSEEGIFACGNVLQVHDLVDFVSEEAEMAGMYASKYILEGKKEHNYIDCKW